MQDNNKWLWKSHWTQWVIKKFGHEAEKMLAPCMDPEVLGFINENRMLEEVRAFKDMGINTLLTEGLRRLMLFEHNGITKDVIRALKKASDICHKEGIKIIHHTTASFVGQSLEGYSQEELKWLSIDAQTGKPAFLDIWGGWYLWCINNPGFRTEYFRLCRKVMNETGIDGFMVDEVYFRTGWHNCTCCYCREKFLKATGYHVSDPGDNDFWGNFSNPAFRNWLKFRSASVGDFYEDLHKALKATNNNAVLMGCKNFEPSPRTTQQYGDNTKERMRGINTLFIEASGSSLLFSWRFLAANLMISAGLGNYYEIPTVSTMYHYPNERFFSWALRLSHGLRIWATSSVSLGKVLGPNSQLLNFPDDAEAFSELFKWEKEHEQELIGMIKPLASIAIVFSESTRDVLNHNDGWDYYVREFVGWSELLTDEYLQYSVIFEEKINPESLSHFSMVILPNAAALSDDACHCLVQYVKNGGSLIFSSETGFFDENGNKRSKTLVLHDELGIKPETSTGVFSPEFGKYGTGKWAYFRNRPGAYSYSTTNEINCIRIRDAEDAPVISEKDSLSQKQLVLSAIEELMPEQPQFIVKSAPSGLLIRAYKHQNKPLLTIHILNCLGEKEIDYGEHIPYNYQVKYPRLNSNIVFEITEDIEKAWVISPDYPEMSVAEIKPVIKNLRNTITLSNKLHRYSVLCISLKKQH